MSCGEREKAAKTGGSAFPYARARGEYEVIGMTLRDYFAAKVMQGLCTAYGESNTWPDSDNLESYECVAWHAYKMADAMLEARK